MRKSINIVAIILSVIAIILCSYVILKNSERKITVSFNTNSSTVLSNLEIAEGESIVLPVPERDGYDFLGWYINDEKIDSNYKFNKTTILNAKWQEKLQVKTYTVTFDTIEIGSYAPAQIVKYGENIKKPEVEINNKEGNFINCGRCGKCPDHIKDWQLDGHTYDFNTPVISDITLKAVWEYVDNQYGQCGGVGAKPIIYLYPEKEIEVEVRLGNLDDVTTIYPKYNNSWKVKAYPNGKLINKNTGRELYSLYWEGKNYPGKVTNEGFVIEGKDTSKFLEEKLAILGLTEREAEEFIIYWLPQMEHNKYNYIKFTDRNVIDSYMPLSINPKPDTLIRIMMEFMPLDKKINVQEQRLDRVNRIGFVVVEWGGSKLNTGIVK